MFAICVESSHMRGMGHLFRALNLISYLEEKREPYILLLNNDSISCRILSERGISYETVDFSDEKRNWEKDIIRRFSVDIWLNDKFESSYALFSHVKEQGILLAAIDEHGANADILDVHFAGMLFGKKEEEIPGKKVYAGLDYNILNAEIRRYRKKRRKIERIVVSLGGSDTYGATILVVKILKKYGYSADIITGAGFQHSKELKEELKQTPEGCYCVLQDVPSLIETFSHYDLAVTGGGVTCLEANGAGLPCIVVANEPHEIHTGKYLEKMGGALFAGYYQEIEEEKFRLAKLDVEKMSKKAMEAVTLDGCENIYRKLCECREVYYGRKG